MSDAAKYRADMKAKAHRMANGNPGEKVDASGWTAPEPLNTTAKTGMRPVSRQNLATGGAPQINAGRKPRKSGGRLADDFANVNQKDANEDRSGVKHIGGMKNGGRPKRADGGGILKEALGHGFLGLAGLGISKLMGDGDDDKAATPVAKKRGGRADGGMTPEEGANAVPTNRLPSTGGTSRMSKAAGLKTGGSVSDGKIQGTRPTGGRMARKSGGAAKGKMNVNIIIAQPSHETPPLAAGPPTMPPPPKPMVPPPAMAGPPPGAAAGPPPMPPGMPPMMARRRGGRTYPLDAGSGSGLGRLEKTRAYGEPR